MKESIEKSKLYNGEVELIFDPAKHHYTVNGQTVYGITTILSVINKPALIYWATGKASEKFKELIKPGVSYDEVQIMQIAEKIKNAHREHSDQAKLIGTMVHEHIEKIVMAIIAGEKIPERPQSEVMNKCIDAFAKWTKENKVEFLEHERKVYSKKYNYAGTLDLLAKVDGKLSLIDIKTSTGIYDEYFFQTAAYSQALLEEMGNKIERNYILRVDKLGKGFEVAECGNGDIDLNFKQFEACHTLYLNQVKRQYEKRNKNV